MSGAFKMESLYPRPRASHECDIAKSATTRHLEVERKLSSALSTLSQ
jgi:hypothetical protein